LTCLLSDPVVDLFGCRRRVLLKVERLKRRTVFFLHQSEERLPKIVTFLREETVGDRQRDRLTGATVLLRGRDALRGPGGHLFQCALQRSEGRMRFCAIRKMQSPGHLGARRSIRAAERHGQGGLDRIRRKAKIIVARRELPIKIQAELVRRGRGQARIRRVRCGMEEHRDKEKAQKNAKGIHL
jgi:hypothetical protein